MVLTIGDKGIYFNYIFPLVYPNRSSAGSIAIMQAKFSVVLQTCVGFFRRFDCKRCLCRFQQGCIVYIRCKARISSKKSVAIVFHRFALFSVEESITHPIRRSHNIYTILAIHYFNRDKSRSAPTIGKLQAVAHIACDAVTLYLRVAIVYNLAYPLVELGFEALDIIDFITRVIDFAFYISI